MVVRIGEQPEERDDAVDVVRLGEVQHVAQEVECFLVLRSRQHDVSDALYLDHAWRKARFLIPRQRTVELESGLEMWLRNAPSALKAPLAALLARHDLVDNAPSFQLPAQFFV